jgi:hypothetical protein
LPSPYTREEIWTSMPARLLQAGSTKKPNHIPYCKGPTPSLTAGSAQLPLKIIAPFNLSDARMAYQPVREEAIDFQ